MADAPDDFLTRISKPPSSGQNDDFLTRISGGSGPSPAKAKVGDTDPLTGQPYQFMSSSQGLSPAQSSGAPIDEGREPGLKTQAIIGLGGDDKEQRRRIAAAQLYPDKTPEDAQSRVFYGDDGRLAAVGENGKPYFIDPPAGSWKNSPTSEIPAKVAGGLGGVLPTAGGALGGAAGALLSGPTSLVVAPSLAAAGGAAGDVTRQELARYFDPSPPLLKMGEVAKEALKSGASQLAGGALARIGAPNPLGLSSGEAQAVRNGGVDAATQAAIDRAKAQGVDLTIGQASGLPTLLGREDAMKINPATADTAISRYRTQGQQIQDAGQNALAAISPNSDKTDAALMFQQGASDATQAARQQANQAAKPAYDAAQKAGQVMSPDLAQLSDLPAVQAAQKAAATTYTNLYGKAPPTTPDFALWDLTKRQLDDAINMAQRAGNNTDAGALGSIKQRLAGSLDDAYPTYSAAREAAAPGQRLASQLNDSGVGSTANSGIDERARAIVAPVFNQNPRAVATSRDAFIKAGRLDEWNAGVRSYIQDAIDKASQSADGLNPSLLRKQIWGSVDNRDSIKAALTPEQYQGLDNFFKTVEDASRTYPTNSLTELRGQANNKLMADAANTKRVQALDMIGKAFSPASWTHIGAGLTNGLRNKLIANNLSKMVDQAFTPQGLESPALQSLAKMGTTNNDLFIRNLAGRNLAGQAAYQAVGGGLAPDQNQ